MSELSGLLGNPVVALLAKVTLLMACGLLLADLWRAGPALRHSVLVASVGGALALPLLSLAAPRWDAAILPPLPRQAPRAVIERTNGEAAHSSGSQSGQPSAPNARGPSGDGADAATAARPTPAAPEGSGHGHPMVMILSFALWALGALPLLARLVVGRLRLRAIAARAWTPDDASWVRLLEEEKRRTGVSRRVRLLVSPAAAAPMTWGTRNPVVLLPEGASDWAVEHRRIVLRHELTHIARGDALAQSVGALASAVYWFHPLALMAAQRLRTECERACDDHVVALGTEPREYASHLLDAVRSAREVGAPGLLSLAMARPSQLEERLLAVLDASRSRRTPTRLRHAIALSLPIALALAASAFHAVPRPAPPVDGTTAAPERSTARETVSPALAAAPTAPVPASVRIASPDAARGVPGTGGTQSTAVSIVERDAAPVGLPQRATDSVRRHLPILLRADPMLPSSAPVQLALSEDENLVLVNERFAHPLNLRAAVELAKHVRGKYGRDLPGGSVRISVGPDDRPAGRPSDADPWSHLLAMLLQAPLEDINGRPAARHQAFEEHPGVEVPVSDSTLARLMKRSP